MMEFSYLFNNMELIKEQITYIKQQQEKASREVADENGSWYELDADKRRAADRRLMRGWETDIISD